MTERNKILITQNFILIFLCSAISLLRLKISIHPDTSWLTTCAQRLYDGIPLIQGCYDTNPPLSTLIYIPAVVLSRLTAMEIYYCVYATIFVLIFLCLFLTHEILKRLPFLSKEEQFVFLAAYAAATIVSPQYDFSQRDHMIAAASIPFLLVQVAITKKITLRPLIKYLALVLGTLMFMVKPHYGLLPALLIAHRLYAHKRLSVFWDADMIYLAAGSLLYAAILYVFFPDFIFTTLPDIANYYLPYNSPSDVRLLLIPYILPMIILGLIACLSLKNYPEKQYFHHVCWLGTVCGLIAFYLQGKGFYYQTLPAKTFFLISCSLTCFSGADYFIKDRRMAKFLTPLAFLVIISPPLYKSYMFAAQYPTHADVQNAPLTKFIKAGCGSPCSFFMTYPNMSVNMQTSFYLGDSYASRFPAFWFYPVMQFHFGIPPNILSDKTYQERLSADKERFTSYIVEDLKKRRPALLMIYQEASQNKSMYFDYFGFFSDSQDFNDLIKNYEKSGEFETDRQLYFKGTSLDFPYKLRWDVYKLKESNKVP